MNRTPARWLVVAFAVSVVFRIAAAAEARQNIVLLISDQHTADVMSGAGCAHVKTPALDSLAATGVRFRQTYCTYPVCVSSRASLMTGRWPHELKGVSEVDYRNLFPGEPLAHGHLVRTAGFAYIAYSAGRDPEQLFDLRADPGQTRNLAQSPSHRQALAEHRRLLRNWVQESKSPFPLARLP